MKYCSSYSTVVLGRCWVAHDHATFWLYSGKAAKGNLGTGKRMKSGIVHGPSIKGVLLILMSLSKQN